VSADVRELDTCDHNQAIVGHNPSVLSEFTLTRAQTNHSSGFPDVLSVKNDDPRSEETSTRSSTPDVQKPIRMSESGNVEVEVLKNRMKHVCGSWSPDNEVFATEKRPVPCPLFPGIGPTDKETGVPIASKSVSTTSYCFASSEAHCVNRVNRHRIVCHQIAYFEAKMHQI